MIFAAFNGQVTLFRCAIRFMAGWEFTRSGPTPDGDTRLQAAHESYPLIGLLIQFLNECYQVFDAPIRRLSPRLFSNTKPAK